MKNSDLAVLLLKAHLHGQQIANKDKDPDTQTAEAYVLGLFKPAYKNCNPGEAAKECRECTHKRNVPGTHHIECANPDPNMTGDQHGIKNGWFIYPLCFDPTWKTRKCNNHEKK